ncbi:MAG: hypothetical protein ACLP2X_01480, partial [Syntrophobacteraceae bacterium]
IQSAVAFTAKNTKNLEFEYRPRGASIYSQLRRWDSGTKRECGGVKATKKSLLKRDSLRILRVVRDDS